VPKSSKVDWVACHARIEELRKKLRRDLSPKDIVRDAETNKRSPFRNYFTWDLEKGFRKNLIAEARQLIATIKVLYVDPESGESVPVRKYVRLMVREPDSRLVGGYVPRTTAIRMPQLHSQMIEIARQNLESFIGRFRGFQKIETVYPLVRRAITLLEAQEAGAGRKKKKAE
jgi:hypothetical protein